MLILHTRITAAVARLLAADRALHEEHVGALRLAVLLLFVTQIADNLLGLLADGGLARCVALADVAQILAIADHLVVAHGNVARRLVSHVHLMLLVAESAQRAAHRDHVVVRVRTEDDDTLRIGLGALRTVRVVGVGFAARPTRDGVLNVVEDADVHVVGRAVEGQQFAQSVLAVILVGELQDRLIGLRTEPNDGAANQLIIPHARRDEPRVTDACQLPRGREVDHDLGVRVML